MNPTITTINQSFGWRMLGDNPMLSDAELALLRDVELFDGLAPEQAAHISRRLVRRTFPAGTNLMSVEQPGEVVYIILSGTVKIHVEQADGTDVIIAMLGAGDTVGEMSLIDSAGRSATVVTQEESTLLWMNRTAFLEALQNAPVITLNLVRMLSSRLRLANEQIQALATLDVHGRVARQLLAFAQKYGHPDEAGTVQIPIRLTQSDLAGLVGASRERVNQVIGYFKQRRYLSVDQHYHISLHNLEALAKRIK
ncbi:Crp/Fnr family transcriptional regulator [Herpetosiphon llansteffanensis]|uniref:Crp/Fnr family transcriptional regulator n=1 Tax=Herpetosiphon llansteffanensis TaxID=2094568 RepID=UPI000D7C3A2C|nr:Crp/Fnr family transcriptional regulator [Herpetosiphon llansteffanensis]